MRDLKYNTFWPRFWAMMLDTLILLPIGLLIVWAYESATTPVLAVLIYIVHVAIWVTYSILMHGRYGQTLGKMATRVKVIDVSEETEITYRQAFLRDSPLVVLIIFDVLLAIPRILNGENALEPDFQSVGYLILLSANYVWGIAELGTMLFSAKRRAVHDHIAKTVVLRMKALPEHVRQQKT